LFHVTQLTDTNEPRRRESRTYVRDDRAAGLDIAPAVWLAYSEGRRGEHPRRHLKGLQGRAPDGGKPPQRGILVALDTMSVRRIVTDGQHYSGN
jgi:hypothetical protein